MSDEKKIPGMWTDKACAYSDSERRCPVLAATPNNNDARRKGYLHYLSFADGKVHFQVGPVADGADKVTIFEVPQEVAESAIEAAIGVALLWQQSANQ